LWSDLFRYLQNPIPNKMNNKLLIIVLLASITLGLSLTAFTTKKKADKGIEFYEGNFNDALAKAKSENKIIFMDAYASWCGPCKKMAANVFTDEKAGEYFNANFVNLKMDMEKGEGPEIARKYPVQYYPTLFFIDSKGNVVKKIVGYHDVEQLIKEAKSVK
jgi:thioredoxin 1